MAIVSAIAYSIVTNPIAVRYPSTPHPAPHHPQRLPGAARTAP